MAKPSHPWMLLTSAVSGLPFAPSTCWVLHSGIMVRPRFLPKMKCAPRMFSQIKYTDVWALEVVPPAPTQIGVVFVLGFVGTFKLPTNGAMPPKPFASFDAP